MTTKNSADSPELLRAEDVGVEISGRQIVAGFSLSVRPGERVAIVGPSGSGKTTVLNALGLLSGIDAGEIRYSGERVDGCSRRRRRRLYRGQVGSVIQDYALIERWSIGDNVAAPLKARGVRGARRREGIDEALATVGLAGREGEPVAGLSGGEKQRVAIARLLAARPRIVLADEPTGSLDPENRDAVLDELAALAEAGSGIVVVTHDPAVAEWTDRVVRLG